MPWGLGTAFHSLPCLPRSLPLRRDPTSTLSRLAEKDTEGKIGNSNRATTTPSILTFAAIHCEIPLVSITGHERRLRSYYNSKLVQLFLALIIF